MNQTWNNEAFKFRLTTDKTQLQIERIHQFLSEKAYWCLGIPRETVEKAIANSLCFGLFDVSEASHVQAGFARMVTDGATFAWLCDVYVEDEYRGQNLSKWMIECLLTHPDLQGLRRICLATRDAHTLYERYGFAATKSPENWLEIKIDDLYRRKVIQLR